MGTRTGRRMGSRRWRLTLFDAAEYLDSPEAILGYLEAVFGKGDDETRVIPAEAGTHEHGLCRNGERSSLFSPPSAFMGPGFRRGDYQPSVGANPSCRKSGGSTHLPLS